MASRELRDDLALDARGQTGREPGPLELGVDRFLQRGLELRGGLGAEAIRLFRVLRSLDAGRSRLLRGLRAVRPLARTLRGVVAARARRMGPRPLAADLDADEGVVVDDHR